ncbi:MAG: RDD family protein [Clostridia bacterium]|nr:RDD family protein [Clostridia bacterium]
MTTFDYEPLHNEEHFQTINETPKVRSPWRRFFARTFDYTTYGILLMVIQSFVFNINVGNRTPGGNILDSFITYFLMILIEPVLLKLFGTTLGKWLMGLSVTDEAGNKLSYGDGFSRTLTVFWRGFGLNIPIYSLVRLAKSYSECDAGETLEWEADSVIHLKDEKKWRIATFISAYFVLFVSVFLIFSLASMPQNRGDITVEEFNENYNRFAEYYSFSPSRVLNDDGEWVKREQEGNVIYIGGEVNPPTFEFIEDSGIMTGMRFSMELINNDSWTPSYNDEMVLSILSFVQAQEGSSLFKSDVMDLIKQIQEEPFTGFQRTIHGVTITCDYDYSGYVGVTSFGYLFPDEDEDTDRYYSVEFEMIR